MKRLFAAIICTIALLVTWVSCNSNVTTAPEAVVFDSLFIDSICPLFRNYEQPACHITIRLDKPSSEHPASLVASMERALTTVPRDGSLVEASEGTLAGLAKAYVREFIFQYLLDGKEAIDSSEGNEREASSWMNYEENVEGRVLYNANGLVGYQFNIYSYAGGAHGNNSVRNCVYDCRKGRLITLADLFAPESLMQAGEMLRNRLVKDYDCATMEELIEKCDFFSLTEIEPTENFMIDDNGLCWSYDPYEIAPYVMGTIEVKLPWVALKPLLRVDSPVTELAEQYRF